MKLPALREIKDIPFNSEDTLVIFGEVFQGGYVSGLIKAAQKKGMHIVYSTVGRRDKEGTLRPLNQEELAQQPKPIINIPLEAGFDMTPSDSGKRPIDLCQNIPLKEWQNSPLDKNLIEKARLNAISSFRSRVQKWSLELSQILPKKGNVLMVHTMAGGVPRAKILLPVLNRVLKGVGDRFVSSETFWHSDLGWLCKKNFSEVTAQTYKHLIELTSSLRSKLLGEQRQVFYTAYSYHGTEILIGDEYQWQSYYPYLQGFAKIELENISKEFFHSQVKTCVFNVPEILTKSSAAFPGVEVPLYTILGALKKQKTKKCEIIVSDHLKKMKDNTFNIIMDSTKEYFTSIKEQSIFGKWPQQNHPIQMEEMIKTSKNLASLHKDKASSITPSLSEVVLNSSGNIILQEISAITNPVLWLGHDIIVSDFNERDSL